MDIQKKHYNEIDIYRGLGIILVVLGHALKQTGETNILFDIGISVIYSFHMPLFFVASGFIAIKILDINILQEKVTFIKNRAVRLLIPYFAVGLFYMPIKFVLSKFAVKPYDFNNAWKLLIGENPNTVLWFLYTLFIISVLCVFILNRKNIKVFLLISAAISICAWSIDTEFNTFKYLFFFIAGIFLRMHYDKAMALLNKGTLALLFIAFIVSNILLYSTHFMGWTIITATTGCLCMLIISRMISISSGIIHRLSSLCGEYSMDIYILSDLIATAFRILLYGLIHMHYIPCTAICFMVSMLLPIPISKFIIRRIKLFKLLILGEK